MTGRTTSRGYGWHWQRLRDAKIEHDPLCEQCQREGRTRAATEVDHIEPFQGRQDPRRLQWSNLQSLCRTCHERKTHRARPVTGADDDGWPTDPNHWWNQ